MTTKRTGYINNLDTIEEMTAARLQTGNDYVNVSDIVATVLGHYDCDGVAIVALEVALYEYFFDTMHAYDREVDQRLVDMCTTDIMSEAAEE